MFKYGIDQLTLHKIQDIATGVLKATIDKEAEEKIISSRKKVEIITKKDKAVYGINTGFGPLCDVQISPEETNQLQTNLLITHAVGVGENIDKRLSKIMMICKVHALCQGFSGVRLKLIERIIYFIENDLLPTVPKQGSVGASGDLAPLSHLFLPLIGEGDFWIGTEIVPAKEVLKKHHLAPLELHAKEGLGLINGTQFILAHAITGLLKMEYLLDLADISGAMSIEGYKGSSSPFREELHAIRPFKGSIKVAERMRNIFKDSQNITSHENCERIKYPRFTNNYGERIGNSYLIYYHKHSCRYYVQLVRP
jgi:histidine ammonia-lyase